MDVLTSRRFGMDIGEAGMDDFLDTDMLSANCSLGGDGYMDNDWLDCLFDDPVLNDKMITDAAQLTRLHPSDHSYSINDLSSTSSLLAFDDFSKELENDLLSTALDLSQKPIPTTFTTTTIHSHDCSPPPIPHMTTMTIKQEPIDFTMETVCKNTMTTITTPNQKPHTIILTTPSATGSQFQKTEKLFLPKSSIKVEPVESLDHCSGLSILDSSLLPPTPPSSASSDSEGSQSPGRSSPSSPIRQLISKHGTTSTYMSKDFTPLFTTPIPTSGYLLLSEEEKRTLITEGYPVPGKLPLTKQEEKNLKKVRRKIKNKISAQESRRKKKEYMEALEKRIEVFSQENGDLKKRVGSLESNNRSLLGQLQKLQAMVGKIPRPSVPPATQAGSVLMVLVLCFAMFLGSGTWSPTSLNIGYSSPVHQQPMNDLYNKPQPIHPSPVMGPGIERVQVDQYSTPNVKSRVLLSLRDEYDDLIGPEIPGVSPELRECQIEKQDDEPVTGSAHVHQPNIIIPHDSEAKQEDDTAEVKQMNSFINVPPPPQRVVVDARVPHVNDSADTKQLQALMHPDIATTADLITIGNMTATQETVS